MKKIMFAAVSALALSAMADGVSSTQFGVLRVPSSMKQTIVAIPWTESTTTNAAVCVSNMVLTSGLEAGDYLRYYNGTKYENWVLVKGDGGKYWQSVNDTSDSGNETSEDPSKAGLARGKSIILDRCGSPALSSRDVTDHFYIMGKPASGTATNSLATAGYSLIAPTSITTDGTTVSPVKISSLKWTDPVSTKDYLYVYTNATSLVTYRYIGNAWYNVETGKEITDDDVIPAGTGAWFYSSKEKATRTVEL